jgi:hypothetical protein
MTPIATKNNAIILKDGKLAENCGCCNWCKGAQTIEVSISSQDTTSNYKQELPERFAADSSCCLQSSDELFTSYVFAGQRMSGTFSLTKLASLTQSRFFGSVDAGTWYYSFSDDDIAFEIVLYPVSGTISVAANGWQAWHYQLNENSWCQQPNSTPPFDCRSPTSHTARYYGVGERQAAINDNYTLSCPSSFIQQCSNGIPNPCFHGPQSAQTPSGISRRGQALAGATASLGASASAALNCSQSSGNSFAVGQSATARAAVKTDYLCGVQNENYLPFDPVLQDGAPLVFIRSGAFGPPNFGDLANVFTIDSVTYT